MGLEQVTQEIVEDAETEAEDILERAKAEKEDRIHKAEKEAEKILEQAEREAEEEAEALRQKELSSARMKAKELKREAREDALQTVFDRFRESLDELDEEEQRELVANALERLEDDVDIGVVQTREPFKDLAEEYGAFEELGSRGIIVESADGSRRFDLRFDTVAQKTVQENRHDVAEVVFG